MRYRSDRYTIEFNDLKRPGLHEFAAGENFGLNGRAIRSSLLIPLPPRINDLLRIAASVYLVDRLVKRDRRGGGDRWSRWLFCSIEVVDADFWKQKDISRLVSDALQFVSGDTWELEFRQDASLDSPGYQGFFDEVNQFDAPPVVCLYSGGLDSAAGLARRLRAGIEEPLIPVTVGHRTDIAGETSRQLDLLARLFSMRLHPVCAAMSMDTPKQLIKREETSQRARGFLFVSVGGAVAGIDEATGRYQFDILDPDSIPPKKMNYLMAFLNQIDSLAETDHGRLPVSISRHLRHTGLVECGKSTEGYVDLYARYRREWMAFVAKAKLNGCQWANLIDLPLKAA